LPKNIEEVINNVTAQTTQKPVEILLVEDSPADVRLMKEAFKETKIVSHLTVVNDGVEAMAFLRGKGKYEGAQGPDLIFLDLNLPKKNGRKVLQEIKSDERLKFIPVLVLTTSEAEQDIIDAYHLHANCYITKPMDLNRYIAIMKMIQGFWLKTVKLPPRRRIGI
jgi:CheY-like chemotaxis protein